MGWFETLTQIGGLAGLGSLGVNLLNWRRDSRKPYTEDQREKRKELGEHIDKVGELCREALGLANGGGTCSMRAFDPNYGPSTTPSWFCAGRSWFLMSDIYRCS